MAHCRDCKLYDLDAALANAGRVPSNRIARCLWVPSEPLPDSRVLITILMSPDEGENCPCFIKREG